MQISLSMQISLIVSASVLVFCMVYLLLSKLWKHRLAVETRLKNMETAKKKGKSGEGRGRLRSVIRVSDKFRESLDLARVNMGPEEFVFLWIVVAFFPALIALVISGRLLVMIMLAFVCAFLPLLYLRNKINKQRVLFERQLGDALMVLANAIRAGFSFPQALSNVASDLSDPISREFLSVSRDLQLGGDLEASMLKVAERMGSEDLRLITTAVVIQRQVGGNLAEILDTISQTIRDRLAIKRSVKALTAQGRISGKIIGAMPIFLLAIITLINPTYAEPLFATTIGIVLLIFSALIEICGFAWIKKIVNIKF